MARHTRFPRNHHRAQKQCARHHRCRLGGTVPMRRRPRDGRGTRPREYRPSPRAKRTLRHGPRLSRCRRSWPGLPLKQACPVAAAGPSKLGHPPLSQPSSTSLYRELSPPLETTRLRQDGRKRTRTFPRQPTLKRALGRRARDPHARRFRALLSPAAGPFSKRWRNEVTPSPLERFGRVHPALRPPLYLSNVCGKRVPLLWIQRDHRIPGKFSATPPPPKPARFSAKENAPAREGFRHVLLVTGESRARRDRLLVRGPRIFCARSSLTSPSKSSPSPKRNTLNCPTTSQHGAGVSGNL